MTDNNRFRRRSSRVNDGFSLVEVALAMLVVAIGLLAVIGLFVGGLNTSKRAIDDTQIALYADEILNAVEAEASLLPNWSLGALQNIEILAPAWIMWETASMNDITVQEGTDVNQNIYIGVGADVQDFAVRCILTMTEGEMTDPAANSDDRIMVRLEVENGEFGNFDNSLIFVRELYRNDM